MQEARDRALDEIAFDSSLAAAVASTMSLLAMAPFYEGLDAWIEATYAALSDQLRRDVHLFFYPFGAPLIYRQLLVDPPREDTFPAFVGWLTSLTDETIRGAVHDALRNLAVATHAESDVRREDLPSIDDSGALASFLERAGCEWWEFEYTDRASFLGLVQLLQDPGALRAKIAFDVASFWESHFREEYAKCRPVVTECALRGRQADHVEGFAVVVARVTGRPVAESTERRYGAARRLVFVPSCHTGPYVHHVPVDPMGRSLVVIFNARLSERGERGGQLPVRELFAPLKALSDETRLEILRMLRGGELYAQQIVDRLSISQPSVSRHLRLMVASGILTERREEKMKFYRINEEMLATLAWSFSAFLGSGPEATSHTKE